MKVLIAQDIHVDPAWIEESEADISRICEVAKSEKVDGILFAGDFWNRAIMATAKNKYNRLLGLGRRLQEAAQCFFIYGTNSHDADESYSAFIDIGWKEIGIGKSEVIGDLLICGMPEITPAVITAKYPELDKAEIISKEYELVNKIIDEYYVPLSRSWHDSIKGDRYVHFMGHGHIAGAKFRDDQKPRTSDFMITEEMLGRIDADYIHFGHLHLPQKYYGGSAHLTWGDLNFKAGFNVITYEGGRGNICCERFDYNKPMRKKYIIKEIADFDVMKMSLEKGVDTWIDIECNKEFADQFDSVKSLEELNSKIPLGPLSKITTNIQHEEHIRVDTEQYEACKTTEDLYKIYDSEAKKSLLLKVAEAEKETGSAKNSVKNHDFRFGGLYLRGSKAGLENGVEEIRIDWDDFKTGVNLITGPNGTGKSFLMGFCTPFSEHLPTGADFKTLFELKDSQILRWWYDGDNKITQKILIDPVLSSPTAKYYMDINGESLPGLKGNKKPFEDAVTEIFGSIQMFMSCAFRGQDFNPKYPTLDKAGETDLRQIFTELSGVDRSPMKKYAHDKAIDISKKIDLIDRDIENLESLIVTPKSIQEEITWNSDRLFGLGANIQDLETSKESLQSKINEYNRLNSENENINKEIEKLEHEKWSLISDIDGITDKGAELDNTLKNADSLKSNLKEATLNRDKFYKLSKDYQTAFNSYDTKLTSWTERKDKIDLELQDIVTKAEEAKGKVVRLEAQLKSHESECEKYQIQIDNLNKPCEHCGKLPSIADEKISELEALIKDSMSAASKISEDIFVLNAEIEVSRAKYANKRKEITTRPELSQDVKNLKIQANSFSKWPNLAADLEAKVNGLKESEQLRDRLSTELEQKTKRKEEIRLNIQQLNANLNRVDNEGFENTRDSMLQITRQITEANTETGRLTAQIEALREKLTKNGERVQIIKDKRLDKQNKQLACSEWEKIENAFAPKGIPALELSLIAPLIDKEANRLLRIHGTRYQTEIITQDYDSKGKNLVEKFKILVHDSKANDVKNLPVLSGGQRAWIVKSIQEAIGKIASQRNGRTWLYSIMDEADGPLDSDIITVFYDMMNSAADGKKKIIAVTHSTEAKEAISSVYDIREFFIGDNE